MVFLVAEIGVNWDGDFELAKDMMRNAKEAGCSAVKFQAYVESMIKDHPQRIRLMNSAITKANVETINELAQSVGIEWFCTPMYPEAVEFLDTFVKRYKIRELDGRPLLENKTSKLIEAVLETNKEVIVSCEKSPRGTTYYNNPNIKWLYCVSKYPCTIEDLNFRNIKEYDGFSNHCPHFIAPLTATILGAEIIEIHITSDKTQSYIDNSVSFDFDELENLVTLMKLARKLM